MRDWLTVWITLLHVAFIVGYLLTRLRRDAVDPLAPFWPFLVCQLISFGVRPLLLCYDDARYGAFWPIVTYDAASYRVAAAWALVSTVALVAGYHLVTKRRPHQQPVLVDTTPRYITLVATICGLALAVAALQARINRTGIDLETSDLLLGRARRTLGAGSEGYGYETMGWVLVPVYFGAFAARFLGTHPPRRAVVAIMLAIALVVLAPVGGRSLFTALIAVLAYVYHYKVKRFTVPRVLLLMLVLVTVSTVTALVRQPDGAPPVDGVLESLTRTSVSFDGFEALVAIAPRFQADDVVWGKTYFESLVYTFVPRVVWPEKPTMFGSLAAEEYVYPSLAQSFGNIGTFPVGFVAESLYNFWYFGLVLVPLCLGLFFGWLEGATHAASKTAVFAVTSGLVVGDIISWTRGVGDSVLAIIVSAALLYLLCGPIPLHRRVRGAGAAHVPQA